MSFRGLLVLASLNVCWLTTPLFSQDEVEQTEPQATAVEGGGEHVEAAGPHVEYFQSLDVNGDGRLAGEEIFRLPEVLKGLLLRGREPQNQVIEFTRFRDIMEEYRKQLLQRFERERMEREAVKGQHEREVAFMRYHQSLIKREMSPASTDGKRSEVTLESSPHAEYFLHFDQNRDGVLDENEKQNLPESIASFLDQHFSEHWRTHQITIREFHQYWEAEKEHHSRRQAISSENQRYQNYRTKFLLGEKVAAASKSSAANNNPPANQPATTTAIPKRDTAKGEALKSVTVEIVMLRRSSEKLADQTLASEVLGVLKGEAPSLSVRLLPWLADPDSKAVQLVDYFQAQSINGQSVAIQRGGREPYVSGTTSMGSRGGPRAVSYSMHEVGTMVRVEPVASKEDGKLGLSVQFEKSYLDQAAADIEDVAEQPELPSEDGQEAENPNDPRARGSRGAAMSPFVQPVTQPLPPSIATITAQGNLVLPAGEVGVLSEMAKQKGDVFEEVVILVQWN